MAFVPPHTERRYGSGLRSLGKDAALRQKNHGGDHDLGLLHVLAEGSIFHYTVFRMSFLSRGWQHLHDTSGTGDLSWVIKMDFITVIIPP